MAAYGYKRPSGWLLIYGCFGVESGHRRRMVLRLPQPHARPTAVLLDELDAGGFQCGNNIGKSPVIRLASTPLKVGECLRCNPSLSRQIGLAHMNKSASGPALGWYDHFQTLCFLIDYPSSRMSIFWHKV
jgi:hypothetical protein